MNNDTIIEGNKLLVIVCPKQKLVKIFQKTGKRGKKKKILLKTYRFKEDIPIVKKTIEVERYDWGAWSVSERGWTEEQEIKVYDEEIINSIKEKTLKHYRTNNNQPKPHQ